MALENSGYKLTTSSDYLEQIVAELNREFPNMSNSSNNFAIVVSRILSILLEENDNIRAEGYSNAYVATAVDRHLDKAVATAGIVRRYGTRAYGKIKVSKETDIASINIAPQTIIESGGLQFVTLNMSFVIINSATPAEIEIASIEPGSKYNIAERSTFKPIVAIRGLKEMIAEKGTEGGTEPETDQELRNRYYLAINSFANSSLNGIISEVAKLPDVIRVSGRENNLDVSDKDMPPHSFEIFVEGASDDVIADKIFNVKPAGIQTHGDIIKQIKLAGNTYPISFSRFDKQIVYYSLEVKTKIGLNTMDIMSEIKSAIEEYTKKSATINHSDLVGYIYNSVTGIVSMKNIKFGLTPDPQADNELIIEGGKIFTTDESKINIEIMSSI